MYEYHDLYKRATGNTDAQARWARQLTWEIARHAVGEEIVVYPLMEQLMGEEGKKNADHDRKEHQVCLLSSLNFFHLLTYSPESERDAIQARISHAWYR